MERVKLFYFMPSFYFFSVFFILELLLFIFFRFSNMLFYTISVILFISAFFLVKLAGRTNSPGREIYYLMTAGLFYYYAFFAIPIFTGAIKIERVGFIFFILFIFFAIVEKGNFRNILVNTTVSLMLFFKMIFLGNHGSLYFTIIFILSTLLCVFLGWVFINTRPSKFESRAILQTVFSFSAIMAMWSIFNLVK